MASCCWLAACSLAADAAAQALSWLESRISWLTLPSSAARRAASLHPPLQVVPTRKVRGKKKGGAAAAAAAAAQEDAAGAAAGGGYADADEEDEEGGGGLNPDDLLPRADVSGSITPALLGMIASSNWKERNAGVDQVRACVRACVAPALQGWRLPARGLYPSGGAISCAQHWVHPLLASHRPRSLLAALLSHCMSASFPTCLPAD